MYSRFFLPCANFFVLMCLLDRKVISLKHITELIRIPPCSLESEPRQDSWATLSNKPLAYSSIGPILQKISACVSLFIYSV